MGHIDFADTFYWYNFNNNIIKRDNLVSTVKKMEEAKQSADETLKNIEKEGLVIPPITSLPIKNLP